MSIAVVFDTETTGLTLPSVADLNAQPRIIELGAVRVENGKQIGTLSQLIDPGIEIDAVITKITGLTNDALKGQPSFKAYAPSLAKFFQGADYMIAHNAPFDLAMLKNDIKRHGVENFPMPADVICTIHEYHHVKGRPMRMTELYETAIGKPLAQKHRALDDALALTEILTAMRFWETI